MAALWRSFDTSYLSDELRENLRRSARSAGGLTLIGLTAAIGAALATWSVQDPSLTHATQAPVRNLLGLPGAMTADLLMQLFGLASLALLAPVAFWGWRLVTNRPIEREQLRLALWVLGALAAAAFAACLPATAGWPLPTGLGGALGDALLRAPAALLGSPLSLPSRAGLALATGGLALVAIVLAAGFGLRRKAVAPPPRDEIDDTERDEEPGWLRGWIAHAGLSARARAARLYAWLRTRWSARDELGELPARDSTERIEPRWREAPPVALAPDQAPALHAPSPIADGDDEEDVPTPARAPAKKPKPPAARGGKRDGYELPPLNLLAAPKPLERAALSEAQIQENATALEGVLGDFGVRGEIINAHPGPVVTLYELEPAPGIKSSRVIGLADDIARSMSAISARVAVVSGRNAIGIELPNPKREKVFLRELLSAEEYTGATAKLAICLGKTIGGDPVIVDLARMPHLLIAGTTGSGKSVAINTMILSLLYRLTPEQCRLIMIDPKMLE
ncbi:MAG: DNA translocase FtsK, partial [Variibacter sp.]|nr:DNA translocase FtsK [Variibacter sp.]